MKYNIVDLISRHTTPGIKKTVFWLKFSKNRFVLTEKGSNEIILTDHVELNKAIRTNRYEDFIDYKSINPTKLIYTRFPISSLEQLITETTENHAIIRIKQS